MVHKGTAVPLAVVGCALAFLIDILLPLGVAAGIPYVVATMVAAFSARERSVLWTALLATALIVAGSLLSPTHALTWIVATNRGMALVTVWAVAILAIQLSRTRADRDRRSERMQRARQLLIAICSNCDRVRAADDRWRELAEYVEETFDAAFSHGLCRPCVHALYPEFAGNIAPREG